MNTSQFAKIALLVSLVTILCIMPFMAVAVAIRFSNAHALSVTVNPSPVVMNASTVLKDEISILRNVDNASTPTVKKYNGCTPYTRAMVINSYGGFSHTSVLAHGTCNESVELKNEQADKDNKDNTSTNTHTTDNNTPSTPSTPSTGNGGNNGNGGNGGNSDNTPSNNGNHYGNDKPDNNAKDTKNVHNGDNTRADFEQTQQTQQSSHDNNGKGKKS